MPLETFWQEQDGILRTGKDQQEAEQKQRLTEKGTRKEKVSLILNDMEKETEKQFDTQILPAEVDGLSGQVGSCAVLEFKSMGRTELRKCAAKLGVRTHRKCIATRNTTWRNMKELVDDCEKEQSKFQQRTLQVYFPKKRPLD